VELAPFTRKQSLDLVGVLKHRRVRSGMTQLTKVMMTGSLKAWMSYLDIAIPAKPADWDAERTRIRTALSDPDRMEVLHAMTKTSPADAGAHLAGVRCPALIIEGSADPDWVDPRAEGLRIVADLPEGIGEVAVIDGAGHYPHTETPAAVLELVLPFLGKTLPTGRATAAGAPRA
jgi:pimeloyl-ACP methyl ester carboxylesterase